MKKAINKLLREVPKHKLPLNANQWSIKGIQIIVDDPSRQNTFYKTTSFEPNNYYKNISRLKE